MSAALLLTIPSVKVIDAGTGAVTLGSTRLACVDGGRASFRNHTTLASITLETIGTLTDASIATASAIDAVN